MRYLWVLAMICIINPGTASADQPAKSEVWASWRSPPPAIVVEEKTIQIQKVRWLIRKGTAQLEKRWSKWGQSSDE